MVSTGATNFTCINSVRVVRAGKKQKSRGRGDEKRTWFIEMNEPREVYLALYDSVDRGDQFAQMLHMAIISWKYWMSGMVHGFKLCIVVAFEFYKECAKGELNPEWKVASPMKIQKFIEEMGKRMLAYDPTNRRYPTEEKMRACTQQSRNRRSPKGGAAASAAAASAAAASAAASSALPVRRAALATSKWRRRGVLCSSMAEFAAHMQSTSRGSANAACHWCGKATKRKCLHSSCQSVPLCIGTERACFINYHDPALVGLGRRDRAVAEQKKWAMPSDTEISAARKRWKQLQPARV